MNGAHSAHRRQVIADSLWLKGECVRVVGERNAGESGGGELDDVVMAINFWCEVAECRP